ncbi:MAG TPA: MFS transporter [Alphaproteobacteria bacterium]|nr:MFS transporter [Alphaproteobacteria bacterium]
MSGPAMMNNGANAPVQAIIGAGHGLSHFYMLALPPLFPLMQAELGLSYAALGLLVTLLNIATGCLQVVAGIVADRYGAKYLLMAGLALMGIAIAAIGAVDAYWAMAVLMLLAGVGNSVFHPANYVILNAAVDPARLGRAFSIHTFTGNLGFAAAPPVILVLASAFGWRGALFAAGALSLAAIAVILRFGDRLRDDAALSRPSTASPAQNAPVRHWRAMTSTAVLAMFGFFVAIGMASAGMQAFLVAALVAFHGLDLGASNGVLTGMLVATALGVLGGGFLADRTIRHSSIVGYALVLTALTAGSAGTVALPVAILFAMFVTIGALQGAIRPSRDLLVRSIAPKSAIGTVFAFVSTGLNVGSAIAPALFGVLLDFGEPRSIFVALAMFYLLGAATIMASRRRAPNPASIAA